MKFSEKFPGVIEAAAGEFGFQPKELLADGRLATLSLSHARAVAAWMAYQTGDISYPALGEMLGISYPTIRARVRAVAARYESKPGFRALCDRLVASVPSVSGKRSVSA